VRTRNTWWTRAGIENRSRPLACSALTAYSASAKLPALGAKDRVAVIGAAGSVCRISVLACEGSEEHHRVRHRRGKKLGAAATLGAKTTLEYAIAGHCAEAAGVAGAIDFVGSP